MLVEKLKRPHAIDFVPAREVWCIPNLLSLSRIPLAVVLCLCISRHWWLAGLISFIVAAITDWLDGWWARKFGPLTLLGRNLVRYDSDELAAWVARCRVRKLRAAGQTPDIVLSTVF